MVDYKETALRKEGECTVVTQNLLESKTKTSASGCLIVKPPQALQWWWDGSGLVSILLLGGARVVLVQTALVRRVVLVLLQVHRP